MLKLMIRSVVSLKKAPSMTNSMANEMVPRLLYEEKAQECLANEEQITVIDLLDQILKPNSLLIHY